MQILRPEVWPLMGAVSIGAVLMTWGLARVRACVIQRASPPHPSRAAPAPCVRARMCSSARSLDHVARARLRPQEFSSNPRYAIAKSKRMDHDIKYDVQEVESYRGTPLIPHAKREFAIFPFTYKSLDQRTRGA